MYVYGGTLIVIEIENGIRQFGGNAFHGSTLYFVLY
jgi:hypothetical protein